MKKVIKRILAIFLFCILITVSIFLAIFRPDIFYLRNLTHPKEYILFGYNYKLMDAAEKIQIGMTEQQVISLLGKPEKIDRAKKVPQFHGDRALYNKEIDNPNKAFWYYTGIDFMICIIFDEQNKVAFVNYGGT